MHIHVNIQRFLHTEIHKKQVKNKYTEQILGLHWICFDLVYAQEYMVDVWEYVT